MGLEVVNKQGICHIAVKDEMTIYNASEMKTNLLEPLNRNDEVEVSLEEVSEIDSAGVQIILMLRHEARRLEKELRFVKHSPAVLEVLETLNLLAYLGDPIVLPAGE